ncbi:hypothetical protein D6829_02590, partial [Candidatus Pacearchaeota archaeon]
PTKEDIRAYILEKSPEIEPSLLDKSVEKSFGLLKDFSSKASVRVFEIIFLDGSRKQSSVVEHNIATTSTEKFDIALKLPDSFVEGTRPKIKNTDYEKETETFFTFGKDTQKITYIVDKKLEASSISQIKIGPLAVVEKGTSITGFFLSSIPSTNSIGATFLLIIASSLAVYLLYVKKFKKSDFVKDFVKKAKEVKRLQEAGKTEEARELYASLQRYYLSLSPEEKSKVFKTIVPLIKR